MVPNKALGTPWLEQSKFSNIKHRKPHKKKELKEAL